MLIRLKRIPHMITVPLVVNSNITDVEFLGFKIGSVEEGAKVEAPLSLALLMVKNGIASLDESSLPTLSEINRIAWLEMKSGELQRIDKDFYIKSSLLVWSLLGRVDDFESERKMRLVKALLMDIIKCRLQKIVKLALSNPIPSRDIIDNLTSEEEALYLTICDVIGSWLKYMKELMEGRIHEQ